MRSIIFILLFNIIVNFGYICHALCRFQEDNENNDLWLYNYDVKCLKPCDMIKEILLGNITFHLFPGKNFKNFHLKVIDPDANESFHLDIDFHTIRSYTWNKIELITYDNPYQDSLSYHLLSNGTKGKFTTASGSRISYDITSGKIYIVHRPYTNNKPVPPLPSNYEAVLIDDPYFLTECEQKDEELSENIEAIGLFIQQSWIFVLVGLLVIIFVLILICICCRIKKSAHNRELTRVLSHSESHDPEFAPPKSQSEFTKIDVQMDPPAVIISDKFVDEDNMKSIHRSSWIYKPSEKLM